MLWKYWRILATKSIIVMFVGLVFIAPTWASQSANYQLWPLVVSATGNTLASTGHQVQNCLGQPSSGLISDSLFLVQTGYLNDFSIPIPISTVTPTCTVTPTPTPTPIETAPVSIPSQYLKIFHSQINPTRGELARIRWAQPQDGQVTIKIYNLLGNKIVTLINHENYSAGQFHEIDWQGVTQAGKTAGSGIYMVVLESPGYTTQSKVALIK